MKVHDALTIIYLFIFFSGDDLGDLTETVWPDQYVPAEGLGDLTSELCA